ncbi:SPOR domain-containing protein [Telluria aromaticivorans]|uniref:SPOR domain-containing protein n=1 Tax=Telluria aromaticivorans TaxID=2725995 RepID=A0A7Y2K1J1_9BURK|nr:SPOR domain-containing protein [Telluria aromaticivorans]NNG24653.1 SPOR domain-containing protein [Telluria aromaticivorans]
MTAIRSFSALRQRGSTLTGVIIGLIIGLGIAVAVALVITKGQSPFTDRSNKMGRPADLEPSQATDPNKPLYGNRDAAREANREIADRANKPAPAPAAAEADPLGQAIAGMQAPAAPAAAPAAAPSAPAATPAPAPAIAAAPAPAAGATAPAAGADGYIYFLQAGAFREMSDAENTRAKLALLGFEAAITDRTTDGGVLHRVRVGPYNGVESMNKARAKLLDSGIDVAIVRNQR